MAARKVFINLPVSDLPKTKEFFSGLGFSFDAAFTDENAACLVISEENEIYAMLLTREFYATFTPKPVSDGSTSEVLIALSAEDRAEVDKLFTTALELGATQAREDQDMGWMYSRAFNDLDGHTWELAWMDPAGYPAEES